MLEIPSTERADLHSRVLPWGGSALTAFHPPTPWLRFRSSSRENAIGPTYSWNQDVGYYLEAQTGTVSGIQQLLAEEGMGRGSRKHNRQVKRNCYLGPQLGGCPGHKYIHMHTHFSRSSAPGKFHNDHISLSTLID